MSCLKDVLSIHLLYMRVLFKVINSSTFTGKHRLFYISNKSACPRRTLYSPPNVVQNRAVLLLRL
jgi:hypothetical protein